MRRDELGSKSQQVTHPVGLLSLGHVPQTSFSHQIEKPTEPTLCHKINTKHILTSEHLNIRILP